MRGLRLPAFSSALAAVALAVPAAASAAPDLYPAGLKPGPTRYAGVATTKDVPIVMRDGTKLFADVHRPAGSDGKPAAGRFPVILTQNPYAKNQSAVIGRDPLFIRRGYVQVIVDV